MVGGGLKVGQEKAKVRGLWREVAEASYLLAFRALDGDQTVMQLAGDVEEVGVLGRSFFGSSPRQPLQGRIYRHPKQMGSKHTRP